MNKEDETTKHKPETRSMKKDKMTEARANLVAMLKTEPRAKLIRYNDGGKTGVEVRNGPRAWIEEQAHRLNRFAAFIGTKTYYSTEPDP